MVLGSTRPLTGMRRPVRKADNLTTFLYHCLEIVGTSTSHSPKGLSRLYGDSVMNDFNKVVLL